MKCKMKYLLILINLMVANHLLAQQKRFDFNREKNPVFIVSKSLGHIISVSGNIRAIKSEQNNRIFILGKLGDPANPPKFSTNLRIVIFFKDKDKFKNIYDGDILESFAYITGKVIRYNGKTALNLKNLKDLYFKKTPKLVIR